MISTGSSLSPTPARFRALARSAPWRWSSLEFEWRSRRTLDTEQAWIHRPGRLRVEGPDGTVKLQQISPRPFPRSFYKSNPSDDWHQKHGRWLTDVSPMLDVEGFIVGRPSTFEVDFDDVFYRDYHWVAMLDPFELADCWFRAPSPNLLPVEISDVRALQHHDRLAWQATALPTPDYDPRCSCCALLSGEVADDTDQHWLPDVASTVRLDVETGICVYIEHHSDPVGVELDVRIVEVNSTYPDDLFTTPPTKRWPWFRPYVNEPRQ